MKAKGASIALLSAAVLSLCVFGESTFAGEEGALWGGKLSLTGGTAAYSSYLWRGFTLDKDPVLQPGISAEFRGFKAGIAASMDIANQDVLRSDEVDYWVEYSKAFRGLSISLGHTYYDFPGSGGFSREFYVGIGADIPLSPSLTYYHDYGKERSGGGDGDYLALQAEYSFSWEQCTVNVNGHIGYNRKLFINGEGGDGSIALGVDIPLTAHTTFSPTVSYSVPYGDLKIGDDGNQKDRLCGGVSLSYTL